MATQNPIEYEGTFPLPEAQLDRFLLRITLGYPTPEQELEIMRGQETAHPIDSLKPVVSTDEIVELQDAVRVRVRGRPDTAVHRDHHRRDSGPRRSLARQLSPGLARAVPGEPRPYRLSGGRDFVLPDDVKELAVPMLSHRIIVSAAARMRGVGGAEVIGQVVDEIPVPGRRNRGVVLQMRLPRLEVQLQRRFYLVAALMAFALLSGLATRDPLSYRLFYVLAITLAFAYLWNRLSRRIDRPPRSDARPHRPGWAT